MRWFIPFSFLFVTSLASASMSNVKVIENDDFNLKMIQGCSINVHDEMLSVKNFEKVLMTSEAIILKSDREQVKFELSDVNRYKLLVALSEQKSKCVKRVREYRRHPAY